MKALLIATFVAGFAAVPALAQTNDLYTPHPNRSLPGSDSEKRDDSVWQGAIQSSQPAYGPGYAYDSGYIGEPYLATGRAAVAAPPPYGPYALPPAGVADELPPNRALPGSDAEQRDENVWFGD